MDIFIGIAWIAIIYMAHICAHRFFLRKGIIHFKIVFAYPLGGLALFCYFLFHNRFFIPYTGGDWWLIPLPIAALIIYSGVSVYICLMYMTPYLNIKMPTTVLLQSLKLKPKQTFKELLVLFPEEYVLGKRFGDLLSNGFVYRQRDVYYLTKKGQIVFLLLTTYERLFHWKIGG